MKNALPYYKRFPRDFIEGTIGMDLETKGAYSILLDLIYMQGGRLPDNDRYISGLLGCSAKKWKAIRDMLLAIGKISAVDGVISNSRANLELYNLRQISAKMAENARGYRKNNDIEEAKAEPLQSQPEPEPEPVIEKEPSAPKKGRRLSEDWRPEQEWAKACGLPPHRVKAEYDKFRDYWMAESGQKACKLDWEKTWRNWIRRVIEREAPKRGETVGEYSYRNMRENGNALTSNSGPARLSQQGDARERAAGLSFLEDLAGAKGR